MTTMLLILMIAVIVTAALISALAWRYASDARKRDVARAALLRQAATSDGWDDRIMHTPPVDDGVAPPAIDTMFAADARPVASGGSQSWIAMAAVAVVVLLVAATAAARRAESPGSHDVAAAPAVSAPASPIALTRLDHARDKSGTLTVSGAVVNPSGGAPLDHVMAVIDVLDDAHHVVATVTAGVDSPVLMAGDATRFVVAIPRAGDVSSYRVRFRLRDGAALEHRDARGRS